MTRPLYRRQDLRRLLAPRSIAIVGASEKAGAFSSRTLMNLAHFKGEIYLINPKYEQIGEQRCYPSLAALPEAPDCVIVTLPREAVLDVVRQAAEVEAGGVIIYASGFAETGVAERVAQQQELARIAASTGLRVLGPNCVGSINNLIGAGMLFQIGYADMEQVSGSVGIVSQSGALGYALLQGTQNGQGYTHMLAAGNSCDVDTLDLVAYLLDEPQCKAVALVLEGINDAARFDELGRLSAAVGKPIIIYKTAVAEVSAQVAKSHTGSLAGSHQAFTAAMRRNNFVLVESMAELNEAAEYFSKAPAAHGAGVAVMATSGGAAVMSSDSADRYGIAQPQPGAAAQAVLDANIPEFGSSRNPCDLTGQVLSVPESFSACVNAMIRDPAYDVLVLPQVTAGQEMAQQRCAVISELAAEANKPACIVWLSEWLEGPGTAIYTRNKHITLFRSMDRCFKTIALWQKWHSARNQIKTSTNAVVSAMTAAQARSILLDQPPLVTEHVAKQLVSLYGVPVVQEIRADSRDAAVAAASKLGFPVVLKLDSPDVAHKTELGAVKIGLHDSAAVARACDEMLESMRDVRFGSFLVQPMVSGTAELVLGMKRDPQFGPLVMVGLGGIFVEVFGDVATELAPVSPEQALEMLRGLKSYRILQGYRGKPGVDLAALAQIVADFSLMCQDLAEEIDEIDINPLIAGPQGAVAVDALIVRRTDTN